MIEELDLTVTAAAKMLNVSRPTLSNLINGKAGISPEMAVRLSKTIGSTPAFWMHLQLNYDLAEVKKPEDSKEEKVMSNQQMIETINQQLIRLPANKLKQVANFVKQLVITSSPSSQGEEFIRSLRGKYANSLTPTDAFIQQKQEEIDWEERNQ